MPTVDVSAGPIDYADSGGEGPVLLFTGGLLMDHTVWDPVVERLRGDFRCVALTLPLGAQPVPMHPGADLSLAGIALLVGEVIEALELREVTLVQSDWGGAQVLLALRPPAELTRVVLCSCEAFDNYPPPPARMVPLLARVPGGLRLLMAALGLGVARRSRHLWGVLNHRPLPSEMLDRWFAPATRQRAVRRDLAAYALSLPSRETLLDWARRAGSFRGPVLVVWAADDLMMPLEHGRRLAELFPDARYVEVADSRTLICRDQPERLAEILRDFAVSTSAQRV